MDTTDKENKLEWSHFHLPNIPIYETKLPQDIVNRLWEYVDEAKENANHSLAGNIDTSLNLIDKDGFFLNSVVGPIAGLYANHAHSVSWVPSFHKKSAKSFVLDRFWVNFQNKHEFNPLHNHSGLVSFVVWMKIPTNHEQQHALPICKNSNTPSASDFEFTYSDMLGGHQDYRIKMGPYQEGWMLVFPSQLRHQVYPYYECDEQRISISGNVYFNSDDMETRD